MAGRRRLVAVDARPNLGDPYELRAAYDAHGGEIFGFARRRLADDASAADAVQEVFLRAWRAADRFDPARSSLRTWLYAIARNVVIDELRRSGSRAGATAQQAADLGAGGADHGLDRGAAGSGGTGFEDAAMTAAVVSEALARLSPEHRAALVETYLRDRPYADVAAEAGIGVGTLKTRVFYGLKALRRAMDGMGVEP